MAGKKKITLVLLAALALGAGFYFTPLGGMIGQTINSWLIKLARVEKEIMYSAQSLQFFGVKPDVALDVPFHKQEHALSCEIATLKMALNYHGQMVAESELLNDLSFDTAAPRSSDNVWGNPDKGFV